MNPRKAKASLRALFNPSPADLAARDWRRHAPRHAPSDTPIVVFCAPLMGRHMAKDWGAISRDVARMVASLCAQRDPNWVLVLTSQDRPNGWPDDDPRIRFLPFTQPVAGMDKGAKVQVLMEDLPGVLAGADGYMHALDADDILHPDLVGHIRQDNNGRGYWHRLGGMIDAQTAAVARCGPRTLRYPLAKPFLNHCGSSAAIYVDFRGSRRSDEFARAFYRSGHRNFLRAARAHGVALDPIPFPAALYVMNTGENMRDKRGLMDTKLTYLKQNTLPEAAQSAMHTAFGWRPSAAATAPRSAAIPPG